MQPSSFSPIVRSPPTYTDLAIKSSPRLYALTMLHLCSLAHMLGYHRGVPQTSLPPSPFIPPLIISKTFILSLHPSPKWVTSSNTHITVTSPPGSCSQGCRAGCWRRGQLMPPQCLGTRARDIQTISAASLIHLSLVISQNQHLWLLFVTTSSR